MFSNRRDMKLVYCGPLLFRLLAPVRGNIAEQRGTRMIDGKFRRRMREEKIFRKPPLVLRNRSEALEFFSVDNGQVQARFGAVVKENGIDHFARPSRQPEGNIGNAENSARVRQRSLNESNALHGFNGAANIIFIARSTRENEWIKNNIFRRQAVFLGQ